MKCDEFRRVLNLDVDGHVSPQEKSALSAHRAVCSDCSSYADSLARLDRDLRSLPEVEVPAEILELVRALPAPSRSSVDWKPDIIRGVAIAIPGLALWGISLFVPGAVGALLLLAMLLLGFTTFFSSALRTIAQEE